MVQKKGHQTQKRPQTFRCRFLGKVLLEHWWRKLVVQKCCQCFLLSWSFLQLKDFWQNLERTFNSFNFDSILNVKMYQFVFAQITKNTKHASDAKAIDWQSEVNLKVIYMIIYRSWWSFSFDTNCQHFTIIFLRLQAFQHETRDIWSWYPHDCIRDMLSVNLYWDLLSRRWICKQKEKSLIYNIKRGDQLTRDALDATAPHSKNYLAAFIAKRFVLW